MSDQKEPESYRVNVPASDVPAMEGAPDSGYALVKFTKDGEGFCLDMSSLKLPDEQPEETNPDDDLPLEGLAKKIMDEPAQEDATEEK